MLFSRVVHVSTNVGLYSDDEQCDHVSIALVLLWLKAALYINAGPGRQSSIFSFFNDIK